MNSGRTEVFVNHDNKSLKTSVLALGLDTCNPKLTPTMTSRNGEVYG